MSAPNNLLECKMEAITRVFAFEFNASSLVHGKSENDTFQVVTPTGARCSNVFVCGVLTEVNERGELVHARVADPTGGFDLIAGMDQRSPGEILRHLEPPRFVTVIGKPGISRSGGRTAIVVRPSAVREVDRAVRDTWVITTARLTLDRIMTLGAALDEGCVPPGFSDVCTHYKSSKDTLLEMACTVSNALEGTQEVQVSGGEVPDNISVLLELIRANSGQKGISVRDLAPLASAKGIGEAEMTRLVRHLLEEDECYQPSAGVIRLL
jgi:RPA family protein